MDHPIGEQTWARVKAIFGEAVEQEGPARAAVLDRHCAGDGDVRAQVESLLAAHDLESGRASGPTIGAGAAPGSAGDHAAGETVGRYRLIEKIGEGGFGSVFVAEQTEPIRRRVALKIVKLGMDTAAVIARFEAERQALALMDHPHIARVFDAGATTTGRPYFVMELVKGRPIHEYCEQERLTIRERVELMALVCRAVQHAHQKGVIHRDLKPGNVLVTLHDGHAAPKVIDFGIAKAATGSLPGHTVYTEFRQLIGTPEFMSPEQAAGSLDIDTRSDVYSLGVILYQLLTGATPLDAQRLRSATFDEVRRIIREEEPLAPSTRIAADSRVASPVAPGAAAVRTRWREVRGELDWIVLRALEKAPSRRYGSPERLAEDLERHLRGEAISAGPPTASYRIRKFVSRQRGLVATVGVLVLAGAVGVAGLATGLVRASRERDSAIEARQRETEARARAASAARKYQAADEFMRGVLSNARPSGETGRPIEVAELLDEAAVRLEAGSLKNEPEVQATVRLSLAQSYHAIGKFDQARRHGEKAAELAGAIGDGKNLSAAAAWTELARIATDSGDNDRGLVLGERAVALLRELGETSGIEYFSALQCLGGIKMTGLDPAGGEALLRESIAVASSMFGEHSAQAAESRALLATRLHNRAGNEAELRRVVEEYRTALGPNHPEVGEALIALGNYLHMKRRYAEAEQVYGEALALAERTFGPDHFTTFLALDFYGWVAYSAGHFDEAIERRRRLVEVARRCFGPASPRVGTCLNSLGLAAQAKGDATLAYDAFTQAVAILEQSEQTSSIDLYQSIGNVGLAAWVLGDAEHAELAARRVLGAPEDLRKRLGGTWGRSELLLGEVLAQRGEYAVAEHYLVDGAASIDAARSTSNRAIAMYLASGSLARYYHAWNAAEPSPARAAKAAEWAERHDEWHGQVNWSDPAVQRFKDRHAPGP